MTIALLAPFAMLRVAAVSYEQLLQTAPPRTGAHIARALVARAVRARVQSTVEELLYALIPRVADHELRRDVLALKRDMHNARTPSPRSVERVRPLLLAEERVSIDDWLLAHARMSAELVAAEAALLEEIETHVRGGLRHFLTNEFFLRALTLASPELCRQLQRETQKLPTGSDPSRTDRSLLRYALRSAAKTSPFSSFMHQGPVAVRPEDCEVTLDVKRVKRASRSGINRGLLARIYRAALVRHADGSLPLFRVNSTLRSAGSEQVEALAGEYVMFEKRTWRAESVSSFRCPPGLVIPLVERAGCCISRAELVDLIAGSGIEPERAMQFLVRLIERGIVWELPWTDALDPEPGAGLLANLQTGRGTDVETIRESVADMASLATNFAQVDGWSRMAILSRLDTLAERASTKAGVGARTGRDNVILEDSFLDEVDGAIGKPMYRQLMEVAELIRGRAELAPEYMVMRARFLRTFGRGGRCTDVVRFLLDATRARDTVAESLVRRTAATGAPGVAFTVFLQIAAPDAHAVASGEGTIVINQVVDGIGWIGARHAAGETTGHVRLRAWLASWLAEAMAPREPIDILGRGECSNLQAHPRLTRRVLSWPSEPVRTGTEGVVPLGCCTLIHDQTTDLLELRDDEDLPLAPMYLGTTISMGFGLMNLLRLLSQPFHLPWPRQAQPPSDSREMVIFQPRVASGRIVLSRATWWVRSRHLRSVWFIHRGAHRMLDVAADRETNGIPQVFFAELHAPLELDRFAALANKHRKPLWVDTRNPFCLELLERLAIHGKWVIVREMLPDLAGLWTNIGGERFVSEVHCEIVSPGNGMLGKG